MKVSIDELKALPQQRLSFDYNEKLEQLPAVKPVLGELTLSYSVSGIRLAGRVKTLLKLNCDRCLRPYFQALVVDIEERFVPDSFMEEERDTKERELLRDDFVEPLPPDGILDISDVVYQAVTLAIPTFSLCGDECPGPPSPGEEGEKAAAVPGSGPQARDKKAKELADPRWKNLKTLFPNEDSQQNS